MPWTAGSALSRSMRSSSSSWVAVLGISCSQLSMPAAWQALRLLRTYTWLAGLSPTSTAARPGRTPCAWTSACTAAAVSACMVCANCLPSSSLAAMPTSSQALMGQTLLSAFGGRADSNVCPTGSMCRRSAHGPRSLHRLIEIEIHPADHHLFPGLIAPHDFLRRVGVVKVLGRVVEVRDAVDDRTGGNRLGLRQS